MNATVALVARDATQFREIAAIIGDQAARVLCDRLGGSQLYVPIHIRPDHEFARAVGIDDARKLAEYFGGTTLWVPKSHHRRQRAVELLAEVDAGRMTMLDVALATDYTVRRLYDIKRALRDEGDQLDLPF